MHTERICIIVKFIVSILWAGHSRAYCIFHIPYNIHILNASLHSSSQVAARARRLAGSLWRSCAWEQILWAHPGTIYSGTKLCTPFTRALDVCVCMLYGIRLKRIIVERTEHITARSANTSNATATLRRETLLNIPSSQVKRSVTNVFRVCRLYTMQNVLRVDDCANAADVRFRRHTMSTLEQYKYTRDICAIFILMGWQGSMYSVHCTCNIAAAWAELGSPLHSWEIVEHHFTLHQHMYELASSARCYNIT